MLEIALAVFAALAWYIWCEKREKRTKASHEVIGIWRHLNRASRLTLVIAANGTVRLCGALGQNLEDLRGHWSIEGEELVFNWEGHFASRAPFHCGQTILALELPNEACELWQRITEEDELEDGDGEATTAIMGGKRPQDRPRGT